jgi:hypothetical protein
MDLYASFRSLYLQDRQQKNFKFKRDHWNDGWWGLGRNRLSITKLKIWRNFLLLLHSY